MLMIYTDTLWTALLLCKDFKWVSQGISIDTIMTYDENSDVGYTLEVDLHYPKELDDLHKRLLPNSPWKTQTRRKFCGKLWGTFYD